MAERVTFSGEQLALPTIHKHFSDIESALDIFFSESNPKFGERFFSFSSAEVSSERREAQEEHERKAVLSLLASLEAAFRIDYLIRCQKRLRDQLSVAFRERYKEYGSRVSLEEHILEDWKDHGGVPNRHISDLKGALRYRHWLAHGRYWTPKLGRQYDYINVYTLAQSIYSSLPLVADEN